MDSGSICADQKSTLEKSFNLTEMDSIQKILSERKAILRNSVKLKSQVHGQINDLIETLKERERQLFLEIDEHDLENILLMTAKKFADNLLEKKKIEDSKICSSALPWKELKFLGNPELLKAELKQFGRIEEVDGTPNESCECLNESTPDPPLVKRRLGFNEFMRKFSKLNRTKRVQKESTGSVESFEIIDGPDLDEYQKYIESLKDEDDIEVVTNPDELKSWQPTFPIHEIGYSNESKTKYHKDLISPVNNSTKGTVKSDQLSASGYQAPTLSPKTKKITDPVVQLHQQLQNLLLAKAQTNLVDKPINNLSSPNVNDITSSVVEKVQSDGPLPVSSKTLVPSAVIQDSLNKYLDPDCPEKWLSPGNGPQCKPSWKLNSFISNSKGLHFKTY